MADVPLAGAELDGECGQGRPLIAHVPDQAHVLVRKAGLAVRLSPVLAQHPGGVQPIVAL